MKGKSLFTQKESEKIIALIQQKQFADRATQKNIRNKIRALGFYTSDFGITGGYTVNDFLSVVSEVEVETDADIKPNHQKKVINIDVIQKGRTESDECYVLNLCDEVLKIKGLRQHRFHFLRGDTGVKLPVDIYYPSLKLVIEYREKQHTEAVTLFDKRITKSGINRGEQRKKYDELRRQILPESGTKLIEIGYDEFEHTKAKRLMRDRINDLYVVRQKLNNIITF